MALVADATPDPPVSTAPRLANVLDKLPKGSTTEPRISALE
jgi:hypothetical protein